tara:strand:+ start:1408 stop:1701 length:294 start_codon:yes stop_codon:yes gene_type:complete
LKELERLNPNYKPKKIELGVELEFETNTIYRGAEIDIENLFIDQLNLIWMDFEAIPNMYEEVLVTFQNMELLGRIIGKFYHVHRDTLLITVTLKLQE